MDYYFSRNELLFMVSATALLFSIVISMGYFTYLYSVERVDKEDFCTDNGYMDLAQFISAYSENVEYVKCVGYKLVDDRFFEFEEWIKYRNNDK